VGPYFGHKAPLENQLTLGNAIIYPRWLGAILCQMSVIVTIETFDLGQVPVHLFWPAALWSLTSPCCLEALASLGPTYTYITTLASIAWVDLILLGDSISSFTFGAWKGFILHILHHLHQPLHVSKMLIL
jgi:hypothetical protein